MALLLLRGPQTVGEVRTRTERLHDFESIEAVEATLGELAGLAEPMVAQLERAPGQKEVRWQQLLADEAEQAPRAAVVSPAGGLADRVNELEARVARLEAVLAELL